MSAEVVDWAQLRRAAIAASRHAYVPYSRFPVGAAALTTQGRIVTGCNVENAAYGVVLCAECGVVSALVRGGKAGGAGHGEGNAVRGPILAVEADRELLVALSCVDANGAPITPCGRCRQLLHEHAAPAGDDTPGMLVEMPDGAPVPLTDLLPHAFGAPNLGAVASSADALKGDS